MDKKTVEPAGEPQTTHGARRGWVDIAAWVGVCAGLVGAAWVLAVWIGSVAGGVPDALRRLDSLEIRIDRPTEREVETRTIDVVEADENGVQPPSWIIRPAGEYPETAQRAGIPAGAVQVKCQVSVNGVPFDCIILDEDPVGMGFGDAALEAMRQARLTPRREHGVATVADISFTMRFLLE